jgi:hypothetical protein
VELNRFSGSNCPNKRQVYAHLLGCSKVRGNVLSLVGPEPIPHLTALFATIARVEGRYAKVFAAESNPEVMRVIKEQVRKARMDDLPWSKRIRLYSGDVMTIPFRTGNDYYRFMDLDLMCSAPRAFPVFHALLNRQASFPFSDNLRKALLGTFSLRPGRTGGGWTKEVVFNEIKALCATLRAEITGFDGKIGSWGTGKRISNSGITNYLNEHVPDIRMVGRVSQLRMMQYSDGAPMLAFYIEYK